LLDELDRVAPLLPEPPGVLFVDDGSSEQPPSALEPRTHISSVRVLKLRRNLGHQRAIALGLTYLFAHGNDDAGVVMDGDGEDAPDTLPALLGCFQQHHQSRVVFARRTERREGPVFRIAYVCYKLFHRLLVGRWLRVGNFSVVPRQALSSLVTVSEIWNHYAAAVFAARLPVATIALPRAKRLTGHSKMSFVSLVVHGLSAVSVHSPLVAVRMLVAVLVLIGLLLLAIAAVVVVRFGTALAILGWATSTIGALLIMLLNLTLVSTLLILFGLRSRSEYAFVPLRDFEHYIAGTQTLCGAEP
jgi:hypothetical protein